MWKSAVSALNLCKEHEREVTIVMSSKRKRKKKPTTGEPAPKPTPKEPRKSRARFSASLCLLLVLAAIGAFLLLRKNTPDRNLLLITLDTTRADRLGCYGYEKISTPALDSLAAQGVLFENAVSSVPLTLPSHTTLLTGLYPSVHGIHDNTLYRLSGNAVTLAELMRGNGYRTGAVVGAFVLDSTYGLDQGFDSYDDELPSPTMPTKDGSPDADENMVWLKDIAERPAAIVTSRAVSWLKENSHHPFFLWVHYYDPHFPYTPPPGFAQKYEGRPYDGEIAAIDRHVGMLIEELRDAGLLNKTLIVVAGDHGESLGDHGEETHSVFVYESTLRVPLIMRYPAKLPRSSRISPVVSLADVMPTVLDLLDIDHQGTFSGMSLVDLMEGKKPEERSIYLESLFPYLTYGWSELQGVRTSRWKYIRVPSPELYDLGEDPREERNLATEHADIVARLEGDLENFASGSAPGIVPLAEDAALSPLNRERLTALGYLSGGVPERQHASLKDPKEMIRYHELMALGQQAIQAGKYSDAAKCLREVVEGDPTNALARNLLGMVYYQEGDLARSKEQIEKAIELNPKNLSDAHYNLGIVFSRLGRHAEAAASYEKAFEIDPARGEYCVALARTYGKTGEAEKAEAMYGRAIELGYRSLFAYLGRGSTLAKLHRFDEAEACYREALGKFPDSAELYNEWGNLLDMAMNFPEAIANYRKSLSLDPAFFKARYNLARMLLKTGNEEEAKKELLSILQQNPDQPEATFMLGELAYRQGDREKAREYYSRYLAIGPANEAARAQVQARLRELR
jgi:arylsulfatase A-like enzyme/Flp pilus assembly protein TadD